jgi:hypothetical protein
MKAFPPASLHTVAIVRRGIGRQPFPPEHIGYSLQIPFSRTYGLAICALPFFPDLLMSKWLEAARALYLCELTHTDRVLAQPGVYYPLTVM